jgi:predicted nucleic acid-binding protein
MMSHLGSWLDDVALLVGDASVWINLAATGRAERILRSAPARFAITTTALGELDAGRAKGRQAAILVAELIEAGLIDQVALGPDDETVFLDLVAGPTSMTLDDGEAATIAFALGAGSAPLIDERKATAICSQRYPSLAVLSTTDLLFANSVASALTPNGLAECLFLALSLARMRIPNHHLARVCELLGSDRRRQCRSLPAAWREGVGQRLTGSESE